MALRHSTDVNDESANQELRTTDGDKTVILKIRVDYITLVNRDLLAINDFGVKILMSGNPNPVILQNGEDDSTPMCAKNFLEQIERCEKEKRDLDIAVEEHTNIDKQKAWLCDCNDDCDYVENVTCSTDELNKTVTIFFTSRGK